MSIRSPRVLAPVLALAAACGSPHGTPQPDSRRPDATLPDVLSPAPSSPVIPHLVVIVQENKSFDTYFGKWCTAAPGSNPTCHSGPSCCEAGPAKDPSGASPVTLDDTENENFDPDHEQVCEEAEIDGGKMDRYVTGAAPSGCNDPQNFAYAPASLVAQYQTWATTGALADRWFQPVAGESSSNDMYLDAARFVFLDNTVQPKGAVGSACETCTAPSCTGSKTYATQSLGDLLDAHMPSPVTWSWYAEGYSAGCPSTAPAGCVFGIPSYPCVFDPSDIPSEYYATTRDKPEHLRDLSQLATDLSGGTLPSIVFVKAIGWKTEHPGVGGTITEGIAFVQNVVSMIQSSSYGKDTLILITWDESGGYFDHVPPPPQSAVDGQDYGPRVPLLALGPYAKKNYISHVTMEHSSIVRFIEWNWLGGTGQLGARDAVVNDIGDLIDPTSVSEPVPTR